MSIIPFILDGDDRTVVQTREEFEKAKGLDGDVIFIQGLDTSQLRDTLSSNASYDLRVGGQYKDHRDSNPKSLSDKECICLRSGAAIIIETSEFVQFPKSRFGHIVPKVGLGACHLIGRKIRMKEVVIPKVQDDPARRTSLSLSCA